MDVWYVDPVSNQLVVSELVFVRTQLRRDHFRVAQRWLADATEDAALGSAPAPISTDPMLSARDMLVALKVEQLRQHHARAATATVTLHATRPQPHVLGYLVLALLVLASQHEQECRHDPSMPGVCVVLSQRNVLKVRELIALLQPADDAEVVTGEQLLEFTQLIADQFV